MVWLPGFVGYRTQWLSLSFTTLILKLEGHLGKRVCLRSFGGERGRQWIFVCTKCICYFFWIIRVKDQEKGKNTMLRQAWVSWPVLPFLTACCSCWRKEFFFLLSSLSCWWLCCLGLLPCTDCGTWALLWVNLTHQNGRKQFFCWIYSSWFSK